MDVDLVCSLTMLGAAALLIATYAVRVVTVGARRSKRVEQAGTSVMLGRGPMEFAYWLLAPVVRGFVALGIGANTVTWLSLVFGAAAGVALAFGHFGLAVVASTVSSLLDALDGQVARAAGTSSDAGEVLDAAVDRYTEVFFLSGLAFLHRDSPALLGIVLAALLGSFMVSYSTAKAEALHVTPPRGAMRRAERAVYLATGAGITPVAAALATRFALPTWLNEAPMLAAVTIVAIVTNVSAVRRLSAVAALVRAREPAQPVIAAQPASTPSPSSSSSVNAATDSPPAEDAHAVARHAAR